MSTYTLADWKNTATISLMGMLPNQSYDSGFVYVEAYLSNVGGWIPDNPAIPTGYGQPADHTIPSEAATNINAQELGKNYDSALQVTVVLNVQFIQKLTSGLTPSAVLTAIQPALLTWLTNRLTGGDEPISLASMGVVAGSVSGNGYLTGPERVALNSTVVAGGKYIDYKAIALNFARTKYGLDNLWNINNIYVEAGSDIDVGIYKYTALDYLTVDPTSTLRYNIRLNPNSYGVIYGSAIPTVS